MTDWPHITRAQVLARAKQGFGDGLRTVPYSQQRIVDGYRADCSGYVCRVLGLTEADARAHGASWWGGMNTVTLVTSGALHEIEPSQLRAGDIIGNCGPGTAGDAGHVAIFGGWDSDRGGNYHHIYEQCGNTTGPIYRTVLWGYVRSAYHYAGTVSEGDDLVTTQAEFDKLIQGMSKSARRALCEAVMMEDVLPAPSALATDDNAKWRGVSFGQQAVSRIVWLAAAMDPTKLAAALAPLLPSGSAPSQETLEAALRSVFGSLDEHAGS